MRERRIVASPPTEFYLVQLLADAHAWQGATLGETLVDLYRRVHKTSGRGRLDALRVLGDRALYLAGFFGDYVERRGLSRRYFAQMGTDAYGAAHALSDRSDAAVDRARAPVFRDLAADFSGFVDLFVEVRESTSLGTPDEVLALYERFRTTRSPRIAARLARHGVFPDRLLEPRLH